MRLLPSAVVLFAAVPSALACIVVGRSHDSMRIESEQAIIIWDAARKVQHFIREATFNGKAKADFGFLVPTPTQPELAEVDPDAFSYVRRLTGPENVVLKSAPAAAERKAAVNVLERKKVGGMDAAVLETNDPMALNRWLRKNGYVSGPWLLDWVYPYVKAGWKITAFKIDTEDGRAEPAPVRMSFQTERPFFPYREPPTEGKDRVLRVYFIGDGRHDAALAADGRWPGRTNWSKAIGPEAREALWKLVKLPAGEASNAGWLTEFEDRASPRPSGGDLFFARAADQTPLGRTAPAASSAMTWLWLVVLVACAAILAVAFRRRKGANG